MYMKSTKVQTLGTLETLALFPVRFFAGEPGTICNHPSPESWGYQISLNNGSLFPNYPHGTFVQMSYIFSVALFVEHFMARGVRCQ